MEKKIQDVSVSDKEKPNIEEIPELIIHQILNLLPYLEAGRTCILSKSFLQAWSTFPTVTDLSRAGCDTTLTFSAVESHISRNRERKCYISFDRTLLRYHRDNIPIENFNLTFFQLVKNKKGLSFFPLEWIRLVAPKTCLKELSLEIHFEIKSFCRRFSYEIFSGQNLNTLKVTYYDNTNDRQWSTPLWMDGRDSLIKCVSLRVLHLKGVNICKEVLNSVLSICVLLENINLDLLRGFKSIKVKGLRFLQELRIITTEKDNDFWEIDDVPNLRLFHYSSSIDPYSWGKRLPFNMESIGCVTHLYIDGVYMDDAFFNAVEFIFPFLESLTIGIPFSYNDCYVIKSASLKRLTLRLPKGREIDIKVYAPELLVFERSQKVLPGIPVLITRPRKLYTY